MPKDAGSSYSSEHGMDLRYMYDGEMRQTELFRGPMGGAYAVDKSITKRDELKEDGWLEPA